MRVKRAIISRKCLLLDKGQTTIQLWAEIKSIYSGSLLHDLLLAAIVLLNLSKDSIEPKSVKKFLVTIAMSKPGEAEEFKTSGIPSHVIMLLIFCNFIALFSTNQIRTLHGVWMELTSHQTLFYLNKVRYNFEEMQACFFELHHNLMQTFLFVLSENYQWVSHSCIYATKYP